MEGKMRRGAEDKMLRPQGDKEGETVSERAVELETGESDGNSDDFAAVQAALGLLDTERADKIIGEQTEAYRTLIQGARSAMNMLWLLMKSFGARESPQSLKGFSQAMIVVLQLVHYAYALGIENGMRPANAKRQASNGKHRLIAESGEYGHG